MPADQNDTKGDQKKMDNAMNTIIRCQGICQRKLEKLQEEYKDAEACHRDTGWERYWKKMQKIEAEMDELKAYCDTKQVIAAHDRSKQRVKDENQRLRELLEYVSKRLTEGDFNPISLAEYITDNTH
jgi:hypothetical protein